MSGNNHEISENSQKSHETKKLVEDIAVIPSMSQPVMEDKELEEESMESQPVMTTMVDKLSKVANNLGNKIKKEESLKIPAIDLMLRIQAALDECGVFPENQYCRYSGHHKHDSRQGRNCLEGKIRWCNRDREC